MEPTERVNPCMLQPNSDALLEGIYSIVDTVFGIMTEASCYSESDTGWQAAIDYCVDYKGIDRLVADRVLKLMEDML